MRTSRRCAGLIKPVQLKVKGQKVFDKYGRPVFRYRCVRSEACPVHRAENTRRREEEKMILTLPFDEPVVGRIVTEKEEILRLVDAGFFQITGKSRSTVFGQKGNG